MRALSQRQTVILAITLSLYVLGKMYRSLIPVAFIRDSFPSFLFAPALYYTARLILENLECITHQKYSGRIYGIHIFLSIFIPEIFIPLLSSKHISDIGDCVATLIGWLAVWGLERSNYQPTSE